MTSSSLFFNSTILIKKERERTKSAKLLLVHFMVWKGKKLKIKYLFLIYSFCATSLWILLSWWLVGRSVCLNDPLVSHNFLKRQESNNTIIHSAIIIKWFPDIELGFVDNVEFNFGPTAPTPAPVFVAGHGPEAVETSNICHLWRLLCLMLLLWQWSLGKVFQLETKNK